MKQWLIIVCIFQLAGCATSSHRQRPEVINPALLKPVIDLVDNEAAVITVTRAAGSQGAIHPLLARVIGTDNSLGSMASSDTYNPSTTERTLHGLLEASPHYTMLVRLLNPDNAEPRATGSFSIDYSNFSENTVSFAENKFRKSYTYEIGLSFRLLGPEGELAYERKFVHVARQICIYETGAPCLEIRSKQTIQPEQTFLKTLKVAYHNALLETAYGLHAWAEVLRHLKAVVTVYHSSGEKLETKQSATWLRKTKQADYRYLYINLPNFRVKLDRLFDDLEKRGEALTVTHKKQLQNVITTTIRSHLDQLLQARLQDSQEFEQAGIFLLPDLDAIWFQDALSMYWSRIINQAEVGMEITDQGINYDESATFGKLCVNYNSAGDSDACVSINARYYESITETPDQKRAVVEARQRSIITGVLLDPKIKNKQKRYFPNAKKALVNGIGYSDTYIKMLGKADRKNEDRIYLRESAKKAAEDLAFQMINNIIQTFHQKMSPAQ